MKRARECRGRPAAGVEPREKPRRGGGIANNARRGLPKPSGGAVHSVGREKSRKRERTSATGANVAFKLLLIPPTRFRASSRPSRCLVIVDLLQYGRPDCRVRCSSAHYEENGSQEGGNYDPSPRPCPVGRFPRAVRSWGPSGVGRMICQEAVLVVEARRGGPGSSGGI